MGPPGGASTPSAPASPSRASLAERIARIQARHGQAPEPEPEPPRPDTPLGYEDARANLLNGLPVADVTERVADGDGVLQVVREYRVT